MRGIAPIAPSPIVPGRFGLGYRNMVRKVDASGVRKPDARGAVSQPASAGLHDTGPAFTPGSSASPLFRGRFSGLVRLLGFSLFARDALQPGVRSSASVMLALVTDVLLDERQILFPETHHAVTGLPLEPGPVRHVAVHMVRAGALQFSNPVANRQRGRHRNSQMDVILDAPISWRRAPGVSATLRRK